MGNCCGRESSNFHGEGRTLGATPANAPSQTDGARSSAPPKISSNKGGRPLGKSPQARDDGVTAGEAAARAAEERAKTSQVPKGKLQNNLLEQQKLNQKDLLAQGARENLAHREADAATQARTYD